LFPLPPRNGRTAIPKKAVFIGLNKDFIEKGVKEKSKREPCEFHNPHGPNTFTKCDDNKE
jgi:hypothetical protein